MTYFNLKPLANVRESQLGYFQWEAIYDDPQFWVENWQDFVGCRISILCQIGSKHKISFPLVVYVDDGEGYSEATATYMQYDDNQVAFGEVDIPLSTRSIRFDPFVQSTFFSISTLTIKIEGYTESQAQHILIKSRLSQEPNIQPEYNEYPDQDVYNDWVALYEPQESVYPILKRESDVWENRPCISILMPTFNPVDKYFKMAIASLQSQVYDNWLLCIADDCSTEPSVLALLSKYEALDSRIKVVFRTENGHISEASNSALELVETEFVGLMDHDDMLHPLALYFVADQINKTPDAVIIYSDEDKINDEGIRKDPYFKCDFNYDLYLCQNMISHFGVYKTQALRDIGGFRKGFEGSQDYDLALRVLIASDFKNIYHIPRVLYHWRLHEASTSQNNDVKPYAKISALASLREYLEKAQIDASLEEDCFMSVHGKRLTFSIQENRYSVEIIIPSKDCAELLAKCINSILDKTTYKNYRITIIDNDSTEQSAIDLLARVSKQPKVQVISMAEPFNFSILNNKVALNSQAELVCFLNNDTEVISPTWLTEMASLAIQSNVGCVGAKLVYPDNTIQHAGVVLGFGGGIAGHPHKKHRKKDIGYYGRAGMRSEFTAVTAACLMIKQSLFKAVNGFDEGLAVAFNDIDLCLKVRNLGYRVVWTPYAELYHHESYTRGYDDEGEKIKRIQNESEYLKARWKEKLLNDPFYSPNHSLFDDELSFQLAYPPRIKLMKYANDE